jgi:hypothetical protein
MKLPSSVLASVGPATGLDRMVMEKLPQKAGSETHWNPHAALQYGQYTEGFKLPMGDPPNTVRPLTGHPNKNMILLENLYRLADPLFYCAHAAWEGCVS